jgi:hypothetical protein
MVEMDSFTTGYIECAFWLGPQDEEGDTIPGFDVSDLAPQTLATILEDCKSFQEENELLEEAIQCDGYSLERAGHDFFLTRNRHGAGFWDRKELGAFTDDDHIAKGLTDLAHSFDDFYLYVGDDGKLYA